MTYSSQSPFDPVSALYLALPQPFPRIFCLPGRSRRKVRLLFSQRMRWFLSRCWSVTEQIRPGRISVHDWRLWGQTCPKITILSWELHASSTLNVPEYITVSLLVLRINICNIETIKSINNAFFKTSLTEIPERLLTLSSRILSLYSKTTGGVNLIPNL